jgi:hypothetical protein
MQISTTTMESSMEIPQKTRDRTAIWSSDTSVFTQKNVKQDTVETLYTNVHNGTIHNSQALEVTQIPYNWWVDQEIVVYIHNGVLLNHKE